MSWDAGAIIGSVKLDLSEFTAGVTGAIGLGGQFKNMVTEFMENPLLGIVNVAKEAAKGIADIVLEVAKDAERVGTAAAKAGVGVEFFSELEGVGKRVSVSSEALSQALMFLNRNAVDASEGSKEAADGFHRLGISTDFLKGNLDNSEAIFKSVLDGMEKLPTAAERTRLSMTLLGRGGAEMAPLFNMGSAAIAKAIQTAKDFGAVTSQSEVDSARALQSASADWDEMWEGLKKQLAEPILEYFSEHAEDIHKIMIDLGKTLHETLPTAINLVVQLAGVFEQAAASAAKVVSLIGVVTDFMGLSHGLHDEMSQFAADHQATAYGIFDRDRAGRAELAHPDRTADANTTVNVRVGFDADAAMAAVHKKLAPVLRDQQRKIDLALLRQRPQRNVAWNGR